MTGMTNESGLPADPDRNEKQQDAPRGLSWIGSTLSSESRSGEAGSPFRLQKEEKHGPKEPLEQGDPLTPVDQVRTLVDRIRNRNLPIRVDLGSGQTAPSGFIGVDRFQLPGVMVVADLNGTLPFDDDSVDVLQACHSLEHAEDLVFSMKEIYRICRHKAQVCIVAPYQGTSLNLANFYHKNMWNEHTPRFFTSSAKTPIPKEEYDFPYSGDYGLAHSDNSLAPFDFRCIHMEYFYFPEYVDLPPEEQRQLRQKGLNVCDQIMYHLLAVKEEMTDAQLDETIQEIQLHYPPAVQVRRMHEQARRQEAEFGQIRRELKRQEDLLREWEEEMQGVREKLGRTEETLQWYRSTEKPLSILVRLFPETDRQGVPLPVTLYEASADGKPSAGPREPLPEGWQEGQNTDLAAVYWTCSPGTHVPLEVPLEGLEYELRFLGTMQSGCVRVKVGGWEKTLDLYSDKPGGEWKILKFSRPEVERDWFEGMLSEIEQEKAEQQEKLKKALEQHRQESANFEQLRKEWERNLERTEELETNLGVSRQNQEQAVAESARLKSELEQMQRRVETDATRHVELEEQVHRVEQERDRFESELIRMQETLVEVKNEASRLKEDLQALGEDRERLQTELSRWSEAFREKETLAEQLQEDLDRRRGWDRPLPVTVRIHPGELSGGAGPDQVVSLYRASTDFQPDCEPPKELPEGWREGFNESVDSRFWICSTSVEKPLEIPMNGREFELRFLALDTGGPTTVSVGYWKREIDLYSTTPGGEWRTMKFHCSEVEHDWFRSLIDEKEQSSREALEVLQGEIDLANREMEAARQKHDHDARVRDEMQAALDGRRQENDRLQVSLEEMEISCTEWRKRSETLSERMKQADETEAELRTLVKTLEEEQQALVQARETALDACRELEERVSGLVEEREALVQSLERRGTELGDARNTCRELEERVSGLVEEQQRLVESLENRGAELSDARNAMENLNRQISVLENEKNALQQELQQTNDVLAIREGELHEVRTVLEAKAKELIEVSSQLEKNRTELGTELETVRQTEQELRRNVESLEAEWERSRRRLEILEAYLERYRQNRPKGMGRMFETRIDLRAEVSPTFQGLFEASPQLSGSLNDYVLQLTEDLRSMDYVSYWIECPRDGWCGVSVSFFRERSSGRGQAGLEVVADGQDVVRQSILSYEEIVDSAPAVFHFDALADSGGGRFEIRVFAQPGSESGIRLFEWQLRKPRLIGRDESRPFCELHYTEPS